VCRLYLEISQDVETDQPEALDRSERMVQVVFQYRREIKVKKKQIEKILLNLNVAAICIKCGFEYYDGPQGQCDCGPGYIKMRSEFRKKKKNKGKPSRRLSE
jgi:ribosomal protein L37E